MKKTDIKINKEIRSFSENLVLGLSIRQVLCTLGAAATALILYFTLRDFVPKEALSYIIILLSAPFAFLGFFTYNGMTAEEFALVFLKDTVLEKRFIPFEGTNTYCSVWLKGD